MGNIVKNLPYCNVCKKEVDSANVKIQGNFRHLYQVECHGRKISSWYLKKEYDEKDFMR